MAQHPIVISTWPEKPDDRFASKLLFNEISVLSLPLIEIQRLPFRLPKHPEDYQWIVFTSKNGVRSFLKKFCFTPQNRIAAIGRGTAAVLKEMNVEPDYTGSGHSGKKFARELEAVIEPGSRVLLPLGKLASDILRRTLGNANDVDRVDVYETRMPENIDSVILGQVKADEYDLLAVSSPSGIKNLFQLVSDGLRSPLRIVSIGETTTAAARDLGIEPFGTASEQSYEGLAESVLELVRRAKV
jgi:uroporphyrinogen-III synthase